MANLFINDGYPEADDYESNYISFDERDPASVKEAVTGCELRMYDARSGKRNVRPPVLTGVKSELVEHFGRHHDINSVTFDCEDKKILNSVKEFAVENVSPVEHYSSDWTLAESESPYLIQDFCEVKTTWHPIEKISASGSGY